MGLELKLELSCGGARTEFPPEQLAEARAAAETLAKESPLRVTLRTVSTWSSPDGNRLIDSAVVWDNLQADEDAERQAAVRATPYVRVRVSPLAERALAIS